MLSHSQHGLLVCLTQLVLAVLLLCLAVWRLTLQHQLVLTSDWPLYSGVPLLCSGWVDTRLSTSDTQSFFHKKLSTRT